MGSGGCAHERVRSHRNGKERTVAKGIQRWNVGNGLRKQELGGRVSEEKSHRYVEAYSADILQLFIDLVYLLHWGTVFLSRIGHH